MKISKKALRIFGRFGKPDSGALCTFHVSEGDACNARRDWPAAIDHYRKALAISPRLVAIWVQLGHGLREIGDHAAAEEAYRCAIELAPDEVDARFYLGVTQRLRRNHAAAFSTLWPLFERDPGGPATRELAALAGMETGFADFAAAVAELFDAEYYLRTYPDLGRAGIEPRLHYMLFGWKENRTPSADFDAGFYRQKYRQHLPQRTPPLAHYWKAGRQLGFRGNPLGNRNWFVPIAPSEAQWQSSAPARAGADTRAVVIIPVYKGYDETLAAVYHALAGRGASPYSLLVINDRGPDAELNAELERLAGLGLFDYAVNDVNRGFVQTCNRGILELSGDRDVVLLNSDAFVPPGWFDRLIAHADRDATVATVTPFSNNATICSYPVFDADNHRALELTPIELDALAAETNPGIAVEAPTGVGFCFYMRRAAIQAIGALDSEAFKLGYGEENDFCMRALEAGYKNLIAADVFVFHVGSVSFSDVKEAHFAAGQKALAFKHPNYGLLTRRHFAADPARFARRRLDRARLVRACRGAELIVTHAWGGGIDTYVRTHRAALDRDGLSHVTLEVRDRSLVAFDSCDSQPVFLPNLGAVDLRCDLAFLADLIAELAPRLIHVNSFAGLDWAHHAALLRLIGDSGVPYRFIAHDYAPISRFYNMTRPDGIYSGLPDRAELRRWAAMAESGGRDVCDEDERHAAYAAFLASAEAVEFPSKAAQAVYARFYPAVAGVVVPHAPTLETVAPAIRRPDDGRIRVAVIGAIGPHKGSDLLLALARDAVARALPIDYCVVGYTDQDAEMRASGVAVTGAYQTEREAVAHLERLQPDLVFIPSVWPETYCYTLDFPLELGLPAMVFDLGAQGERAAAAPSSVRLDPRLINAPVRISDEIVKLDLDDLWRRAAKQN